MVRKLGNQPGLDGIRAIAILAVMALHTVDRIFPGGYLGVDIFFVLSAFLITSLILAELDKRDGGYGFGAFYWRRALRLGPALILWLFLLALPTTVALGGPEDAGPWTIGALLYVGNFLALADVHGIETYGHIWSLAVEEQFYLLWPITLVVLWRRKRPALSQHLGATLAAALLAALVIEALAQPLVGPNPYMPGGLGNNYFLLSGHLFPLTVGIAAAVLFARGKNSPLAPGIFGSRAGATVSLLVIAVLILGYDRLEGIGGITVQAIAALATGYLILHTVETGSKGWPGQLLTLAPMVWVGRRSYGLYLYHRAVLMLIPALYPGALMRYVGPIALVLSLVLAAASFRWVERPIQERGRAWLAARRQRSAALTDQP